MKSWLYGILVYGLPNVGSAIRERFDLRKAKRKTARLLKAGLTIEQVRELAIIEREASSQAQLRKK